MDRSLDEGDFQVAESAEADFEKNTWTFNMSGDYRVSAGYFALVPVPAFTRMRAKLTNAEELLRRYIAGERDERFNEHVLRHFDPDPL